MLTATQKQILDKLTFPESFDSIHKETSLPENIISAELKEMIVKRWIQVMEWDDKNGRFVATLYFDSDKMRQHFFTLTAGGWTALETARL